MSKTNPNNCDYRGFMGVWNFLLANWLQVAVVVFISAQIVTFAAQPAQAAPGEHILKNPPVLEFRQTPKLFTNFSTTASDAIPLSEKKDFNFSIEYKEVSNDKEFDLSIQYIDSKLRNPGEGEDAYDKVRLRGYVGTDTSDDAPYVAPTIVVKPGDTIRIDLENNLPNVPGCKISPEDVNIPHCFNGTNSHTHGLWISPTGNSDNVLLSINPGEKFQYEYNIPPDHPAGTFWYHPHRHGSTALQVGSGMAGALIVRGDRKPEKLPDRIFGPRYAHGDIGTLLAGLGEMPERVLLFQQIPYACGKKEDGSINWDCKNKTGEIESYDLFGPGTWQQSGRYTSINGEVIPTIPYAQAAQIERWRMIHGGVRDTISLEFRKKKSSILNYLGLAAEDTDNWIEENCPGDPIPYFVIADDGLTRSKAWETTLTTLQPGYRSDALVVFPEAGEYCVIDKAAPAEATVSREAESRQLLAVVNVQNGNRVRGNVKKYVQDKLVAAAEREFDGKVQERVVDDLNADLKLSLFTPHRTIGRAEVANTKGQELAFFIDGSTTPPKFEVSNTIGSYFDPKPYDPNRIDRELRLGGAEEWTLESYFVSHPFHIHVNPFQIVKILNPDGKDVSCAKENNGVENASGETCLYDENDPQYTGLKGVWKDTLWIKGPLPPEVPPAGVYTIVVRTRYQRYIGEFVLHCHILDHEDQGMMQNISIVLPSELVE